MEKVAAFFFVLSYIIVVILFFLFLIYSYIEKQRKAITRSIIILLLLIVGLILLSKLPEYLFLCLGMGALSVFLVVIFKFGNARIEFELPGQQYDERDVMFSRNTLIEGTEKFTNYYQLRPDRKKLDDKFRKEPGLMEKGSSFYNELLFSAANASFQTVDLLQPLVEQFSVKEKSRLEEKEISEFIKHWTIKLGAVDVGFTKLKPHHVYSHAGRGEAYGEKIDLSHQFAIAFTVEMNHESLSYNPRGPVIMESAQQYLNAGQIAVQLAQFLRNLGYEARAHIDANYRVICPIVAQDAGLGFVGRMGLLMTAHSGPRVRLGVVTTNVSLPVNRKPVDHTVIHFCEVCEKCAENCPSQAISFSSVKSFSIPGKATRWRVNHEKCFTFWCRIGTDCGRCVSVCPYSHPNNFIHNLVRWMIKRNPVNRWMALKLDNFFYGKKPEPAALKKWMIPQNNS